MKEKKATVMVLGVTGSLGSMVYHYLSRYSSFIVLGTARKRSLERNIHYFNARQFLKDSTLPHTPPLDYIINCIGVTRAQADLTNGIDRENMIQINTCFPHHLHNVVQSRNTKIIHITTDGVFSGTKGNYHESDLHDAQDIYGKSKSLGEVKGRNFLNIRCSIIGPDSDGSTLLGWFLRQAPRSSIDGYHYYRWNGATTLQFAQLCEAIINHNVFDKIKNEGYLHHFVPNTAVTKYQLLTILNKIFKKNLHIRKVEKKNIIKMTLKSKLHMLRTVYKPVTMQYALTELSNYIEKNSLIYDKK